MCVFLLTLIVNFFCSLYYRMSTQLQKQICPIHEQTQYVKCVLALLWYFMYCICYCFHVFNARQFVLTFYHKSFTFKVYSVSFCRYRSHHHTSLIRYAFHVIWTEYAIYHCNGLLCGCFINVVMDVSLVAMTLYNRTPTIHEFR